MHRRIRDEILSASQRDGTLQAGQVQRRSEEESQIRAINEALADKLGEQKYRIWFKNSTKLTLSGGYLKVGVPNLFIANWIENHFLNEITQVVRSVTGRQASVAFAIDPELSSRRTASRAVSSTATKNDRYLSRFVTDQRTKKSAAGRQQKRRLKLHLSTFVVGPSNELAYNAARIVVNEQQSAFNPLFVHGGYGVGKTHLLQGICNEVSEKRSETNWLYLSAEDFANQYILALKTKKLEAFRQRMRQTDLLVIDDIHFLASKPSMQEEFLHTFNTINLAGKQVVLASDAHPKMISQLSEKLVNRFVSGMVVKIDTPDLETRCRICRQYALNIHRTGSRTANSAAKEHGPVPESVIRYIAENMRTNVRELEGALLKLIAYTALKHERITTSLAKAVLSEHLERCDPIVHVSDIESAVATFFGITPTSIHSARKNRTVAMARHFSMYLTRKHTNMSSSEIGRVMGNKNHATVLLACKKIESMLQKNCDLHWNAPSGNKISKAKAILARIEKDISR
jgi:chromosomal replication initiator protein